MVLVAVYIKSSTTKLNISLSDSSTLGEKTNLDSIYTHSRLMQLRQLKTRFHEIDTYSSSRSTLFHGYLQQPVTVFTYGKGATSISSGALSSRLLATMVKVLV